MSNLPREVLPDAPLRTTDPRVLAVFVRRRGVQVRPDRETPEGVYHATLNERDRLRREHQHHQDAEAKGEDTILSDEHIAIIGKLHAVDDALWFLEGFESSEIFAAFASKSRPSPLEEVAAIAAELEREEINALIFSEASAVPTPQPRRNRL
ncbi:hypothetical protein [Cupriavidus metallidurans]|uniref:hypothetical protein n=1 Tax=Cupriavidus metallidurans TaxID=119219 RepID=UPI000788AB1C|nr:hypothetical protein [Cupriavidus metallidurans]AVA36290.1 hypothetical protein C3Z06_23540 [Cupriavidus metallidurans]AVA36611.1 hypothetical protein C3Z06_25340 [Cupriavidus metallidurans]